MNVMVVEEDPVFGDRVRALLKQWGHRAEICRRGTEALENFRCRTYDLVLLEVLLPDMDADRLIQEIKAIRPEVWIVAMTDRNSYELEVRIREQGILYYMIKSREIGNLKSLLEHVSRKTSGSASGWLRRSGNDEFPHPRIEE